MRTSIRLAAMSVFCTVFFSASFACADGTVVERRKDSADAPPFGYLEWLPPGYDAALSQSFPVVVHLSGISELGNGTTQLQKVGNAGPLKRIKDGSSYFADNHVIVIHPQAPDQWMFDAQVESMQQFFTYLFGKYRIDRERVYLVGLSSGGGGVYAFVGGGQADGVVKAAIAVCGNSEPYDARIPGFRSVPLWSFQSWDDPTNPRSRPIGFTTKIARSISGDTTLDVMHDYPHADNDTNKASGDTRTATFEGNSFTWREGRFAAGASELRLTLYSDNKHDAWTQSYADDAVWDWLLAHGVSTSVTDGGVLDGGVEDGGVDDGGAREDAGASVGIPEGGALPPSGDASTGSGTSPEDAEEEDSGCAMTPARSDASATLMLLSLVALLRRRLRRLC